MIRRNLVSLTLSAALALFASAGSVYAQDAESVEPFKVGTFAIDDVPTVGLVMRDDQLIVELTAANRQWSCNLSMPACLCLPICSA